MTQAQFNAEVMDDIRRMIRRAAEREYGPEMCEACGEAEVELSIYCGRCAKERGVRPDPPEEN